MVCCSDPTCTWATAHAGGTAKGAMVAQGSRQLAPMTSEDEEAIGNAPVQRSRHVVLLAAVHGNGVGSADACTIDAWETVDACTASGVLNTSHVLSADGSDATTFVGCAARAAGPDQGKGRDGKVGGNSSLVEAEATTAKARVPPAQQRAPIRRKRGGLLESRWQKFHASAPAAFLHARRG
eukprot:CAMPEP_0170410796 /NCGR_PEP_ID=MMETSP0117_2-20130122/30084_1 /TAXON_ID=400756 /ORGANISM="Durinskia baltica, Strain CSIRO CS-38" /LENGTH=180 /DNA_ID=CAMNT_0010668359 /DNA_START=91 /DNA_END=630 /DNA_ORIENTATION=-